MNKKFEIIEFNDGKDDDLWVDKAALARLLYFLLNTVELITTQKNCEQVFWQPFINQCVSTIIRHLIVWGATATTQVARIGKSDSYRYMRWSTTRIHPLNPAREQCSNMEQPIHWLIRNTYLQRFTMQLTIPNQCFFKNNHKLIF